MKSMKNILEEKRTPLSSYNLPTQQAHFIQKDKTVVQYCLIENEKLFVHCNSPKEYVEKTEEILKTAITRNEDKNKSLLQFLLGQFYFENNDYDKSYHYYSEIATLDIRAKFQLGILYYDELLTETSMKENSQIRGVKLLEEILTQIVGKEKENELNDDEIALKQACCYNLGKAYFFGFGVDRASDVLAERYWLIAAEENVQSNGLMKAQSALGLFYSRTNEETLNLTKAFHFHKLATENGSLESEAALAVHYTYGLGTRKDEAASFHHLKNASKRGSIYASGLLSERYYQKKLYRKAYELAKWLSNLTNYEKIIEETECIRRFGYKGLAIGNFIYARCFTNGKIAKIDAKMAQKSYSKVNTHFSLMRMYVRKCRTMSP
ncbi:hypothetical protein SNEBB_007169 [Seison nebaliae]|nr:hypothetical protein SNEBB_007169 [Seison nebaliae]